MHISTHEGVSLGQKLYTHTVKKRLMEQVLHTFLDKKNPLLLLQLKEISCSAA